ncbi:hypothetical protein [Egicoccus sp. AB-alg2]|uniref:hypothetical protein n=1 Tax=Egicoccus sp. AB-alg2 TaxID=3242693 RepID=UPI00359D3AB5
MTFLPRFEGDDGSGRLFSSRPLSSRGRWLAILAASAVLQVAYWPIIFALGASHAGDPVPVELLLFGLAFVPASFLVLAFTSRHRRAPGAVLRAMGLFLLVGLPVALLNPVVGLVAGFGAGGIATLRAPSDSRLRPRAIAVAAASVYALALLTVGPDELFALLSAAALPFAVVGIADEITVGRRGGGVA